jgi:hypothetical protein
MSSILEIEGIGRLEYLERILTVRLTEGLEITKDILETISREGVDLALGQTFCVLADLRNNISSTPEARKFGAENQYMKHHLAYAMLADSMPVVLLSNFFIRFNRPRITTRLFKKEEEAILWLKKFVV